MSDLVNWVEHTDPIWLTAFATVAVAFAGLVSIVANFALARQARRSAIASAAGVRLQGEELEVLKRQATLAENQFAASRNMARPQLRAEVIRPSSLFPEGKVAYVHGSEPASDIRIWLRGEPREGATWGLYTASISYLTSADRETAFMASPASAQEQAELPFPEFLQGPVGPREYLIGLTWTRLDDSTDRRTFRQQVSMKEPPGVSG